MSPFIQAVMANDVMAAKQAFNVEMQTRTAAAIEDIRTDIAASVMVDGESAES